MTKISTSLEELRRERVYKFYLENKIKGKKFTVDHFVKEKISKRTIYSIIERAEKSVDLKRRPGSGRKPKIMTKKKIELLKKTFDHQDSISQRQAARKFNCSQSHI
jgi:transposase